MQRSPTFHYIIETSWWKTQHTSISVHTLFCDLLLWHSHQYWLPWSYMLSLTNEKKLLLFSFLLYTQILNQNNGLSCSLIRCWKLGTNIPSLSAFQILKFQQDSSDITRDELCRYPIKALRNKVWSSDVFISICSRLCI